jgi:predicted nucleotidyltransferase component of viral defense system
MTNDLRRRIEKAALESRLGLDVVARDMLQARLLSALFTGNVRREVVLKGGLAMRAAYGSVRHTSDVDLQTGSEIPVSRIRALVREALQGALESGIVENPVVSEPKQTDTVQRWKVNGTLTGGGSQISMTVEVSRRGMPDDSDVARFAMQGPDGGTAVFVDAVTPQAMAAGKVDALLAPNRVAVRDLYDLHLLVAMQVTPKPEALMRRGRDAVAGGLTDLWAKIELMTWEMARDELLPTLPDAVASALDEDAWDDMRLRTGEAVAGWLETAVAACPNPAP